LVDNVNRQLEWLKKVKKDANQRLSRIHNDYNQLDESRYPTNEALVAAKQEKMRLSNMIEHGLTLFEEQYKLWSEYANTINGRTGSGRKSGGKVSRKEENENYSAVFFNDLKSDIKKIRRLLDEAAEELFLGDLTTARQDLKQVTRIMEEYNSIALHREISFQFPRDILDEYEDLMEQLTNMELGDHQRRNNSFSSGDNIQFNNADWEFLGAGFSREREHINNIRKIK
jgi:hypothetical protein